MQSGDFNGDGRDDLAAWYDYSNGSDTLFTFIANVRGGFNAPFPSWTATAGNWYVENMKFVTGDFNGDGRDDLGAMYGYADGHITMFSFLTSPLGEFTNPITSWSSATWGNWDRAYIQAGDYNGDGKDDIAAWYDYADGHDAIHTLISLANGTGGFKAPSQSWDVAAGNYNYSHMKVVSGDYNGDGRDDLGAMYGYSDGSVRMFTWTAKNDNSGGFNDPLRGWSVDPGNWTFNNVHLINRYN